MKEFKKSNVQEEREQRRKELQDIIREFQASANGHSNFSDITGGFIFSGSMGGEYFKTAKLYLEKYKELLNFSEEFKNFELNNDIPYNNSDVKEYIDKKYKEIIGK